MARRSCPKRVADPDELRGDLRRPVVHLDPGVVRDRLQLLELDVEPVADRVRARLDQCVAAAKRLSLDAGERQRDALPRLGALDGQVVHLHAAHADVEAGRLGSQLVALADRARPERARDDGADPVQREGAVDVEAGRAEELRRARRSSAAVSSAARSSSSPSPVFALTGTTSAPGTSSRASATTSSSSAGSAASAFVTATTPRSMPEQAQDRQVLVRLRPRALGRVDHEQEEVDPARARDHVADEALVAGDVDHGQPPATGQVERRVAEVDRDPALLLLGQPVRVLAGQGPDEPGLAVVDVAGRAEAQTRHDLGTHARDFPR